MASHATWADSLGWSHSPMREEAGLCYPAIESFAERPAIGEEKSVATGLLEFKIILLLFLRPAHKSVLIPKAPYVTTPLKKNKKKINKIHGCGFPWEPQNEFCGIEYKSCCFTCLRFSFFTSVVSSYYAVTQLASKLNHCCTY